MAAKLKKKRNTSIILTVCLLVLVSYFLFSWLSLQKNIQEQKQTLAAAVDKCNAQDFENNELKRILNDGNKSEYIERIARDELGYVKPGERVYFDISAGK